MKPETLIACLKQIAKMFEEYEAGGRFWKTDRDVLSLLIEKLEKEAKP